MFAEMSSRMAAWGHPPVSIAWMRSAGRASFLIKNSWSSRVKMSLVTTAKSASLADARVIMRRLTDIVCIPKSLA